MTRYELHAAVWSKPLSVLAPELDMSDTWLRKLCRSYSVSPPPRGYWQKVHAGHQVLAGPSLQGDDAEIDLEHWMRAAAKTRTAPPLPAAQEGVAMPAPAAAVEKSQHPSIDVALAMDLLERDAERALRHRGMERLLADLAARLAAAPGLNPADWRDWLLAMQSELQRRAPPCLVEAWARRVFDVATCESG